PSRRSRQCCGTRTSVHRRFWRSWPKTRSWRSTPVWSISTALGGQPVDGATRFGRRLREANGHKNTIADIPWHEHSGMTRHYSVAQIDELVAALELIADEPGRANKTRQMLQL